MCHILESIQYGLLYMIAAFIGGVGLDFSFAPYTEDIQTKELFRQISLQCILLIIIVYCTRALVKQVPILFLTAKSLKEDRIRGLRLGADDYITKPFSIEELILKILSEMIATYESPANWLSEEMDQFEEDIFLNNGNQYMLLVEYL